MSSVLLILDAATGGKFRPRGHPQGDFSYYGDYNTDGMIPICKSTTFHLRPPIQQGVKCPSQ
jgi:hypothetical protein